MELHILVLPLASPTFFLRWPQKGFVPMHKMQKTQHSWLTEALIYNHKHSNTLYMSDYVQIQAIAIQLSSWSHISRWLHTAELEHIADLKCNLLHTQFRFIIAFDLGNMSAYIDGYCHLHSISVVEEFHPLSLMLLSHVRKYLCICHVSP